MQIRNFRGGKKRLIRLKRGLDLRRGEPLDLLGSAANESARVKECIEFSQDWLKESSLADTLKQIVVLSVHLDVVGRLVGQDADFLVSILAGEALLHTCHDDILCCHEWKFVVNMAPDNFGVHDESGGDVVQKD